MDTGVASYAIDVTDIDETKRLLQQHIDTHEETLHRLPVAVAIFGDDQRLKFSNKAFARLWDLDERWLGTHPSDGEILESLRGARKLPERTGGVLAPSAKCDAPCDVPAASARGPDLHLRRRLEPDGT
jgi:PAS domain-containing protein